MYVCLNVCVPKTRNRVYLCIHQDSLAHPSNVSNLRRHNHVKIGEVLTSFAIRLQYVFMYTTCLHCWYCDFKKAISSLDIRKSCTPFCQLHGYTLHLSVKDFLYMVALIHSFTKLPKDHIYSKPCGHAFILQLDRNKKTIGQWLWVWGLHLSTHVISFVVVAEASDRIDGVGVKLCITGQTATY